MKLSLLLLGLSLLSGCGMNRYQRRHEESAPREVSQRFAYEFRCPVEQVQTTAIAASPHNDWTVTIGADGCGQRAVYVYANGVWVLNSVEGERAVGSPGQPRP